MRKQKQIVSGLLAGAVMLALTACSQQASPAETSQEQTESAQESETAEADTEAEESGTAAEGDGIVQTTAGQVQGTDLGGIYRYLGVPYAAAAERFVPAEEVEPWDGVLEADAYGPMSPQGMISGVEGEADQTGTDNNCQNLNIWTPGVNDGEKRPVMVWLHGGGFSTGSANEADYDGEALSRSGDVVVVSVNHRLNVFGHLDLSAYGDKYQYSANVGMTDIVAALASQISQAWINFAKTGTPSADGLPEWEPYTREGGATMILDTQSRLAYHHDQELLSILAPDYVY